MKLWDEGFVAFGLFVIAAVTYGIAQIALGLGLGTDVATTVAIAVFIETSILIDRPSSG